MATTENAQSELDSIIPPEIKDDVFYRLIEKLARTEKVKHVLEIGSSAGGGSTSAFVKGLAANPNKPFLYCMELSKPRFEVLKQTYASMDFVKCFNASSVPISAFPEEKKVSDFYRSTETTLNNYPEEQVLGWLKQDVAYVAASEAPENGIELAKASAGLKHFDMVLIDGSEFTGSAELDQIYGARIILLDDTNAFKCYEARTRLLNDPRYELIADNQKLRNGFSAFKLKEAESSADDLPIHFFTIVLNGEPFIRYHIDVLKQLPFKWRWHIIEGVASLVGDTAWSVKTGGRVDETFHRDGRSNDGTSEYLDELAREFPDQVTVYRKPLGLFWNGKLEMVSAPIPEIQEPCLLWQVDADELWLASQIQSVRAAFLEDPNRSAAYFWCHFFVGPRALISTRYNYAQNPDQEWLRVWRYKPGDKWVAHEPPTLVRQEGVLRRRQDVAKIAPIKHDETEALGAVFQHAAYVQESQVRFKETYYGYAGATANWSRLQDAVAMSNGPIMLRDYLSWVTDNAMVDSTERLGVAPIAELDGASWRFEAEANQLKPTAERTGAVHPVIVIDGVFFQHSSVSGIARVWKSLLSAWSKTDFAKNLLLLDRAGTAPRIAGIRTRSIPAWNASKTGQDSLGLQKICDEEGASLFVSTYYSTPIETRSVFLAHDFIPELMGISIDDQVWAEKKLSALHADQFICVSQTTKRDLKKVVIDLGDKPVEVIPNAIDESFRAPSEGKIATFREKHGIARPYLLMVGERLGVNGYKNGRVVFEGLGVWARRSEFELVCVGGHRELEREFRRLAPDLTVHLLQGLDDEALSAAYAGAQVFLYPSRYEGFGLPLLEAMACNCPVVTSTADAIIEVAGDAPFYFKPDSQQEFIAALEKALGPSREEAIRRGRSRVKQFDWTASAVHYATYLTALAREGGARRGNEAAVWRALRTEQARQQASSAIARGRLEFGLSQRNGNAVRNALYEARTLLLQRLPPWAIPAARKGWRFIMQRELKS